MAKLYFYYSSMNAGKTTTLLQSSYNYRERGMQTLLLAPAFDDRYAIGEITSRIGLREKAQTFERDSDLYALIRDAGTIHCVMVDEAQFLTRQQVEALARVCDELSIPVLTFGLRTDFQGEPFEGSKYLLAWADNLKEIKTICNCGRKATMVVRLDENGSVQAAGEQIAIGGNDRYIPVCRKHFRQAMKTGKAPA